MKYVSPISTAGELIVADGEPPTRMEPGKLPLGLSQVLVLAAVLMLPEVIVGLVPLVGKP